MLNICCQEAHAYYLPYKVEGWNIEQAEHKEEGCTEIEGEESVPLYQGKGLIVEFLTDGARNIAYATIFLCCQSYEILEFRSGFLLLYSIVDV